MTTKEFSLTETAVETLATIAYDSICSMVIEYVRPALGIDELFLLDERNEETPEYENYFKVLNTEVERVVKKLDSKITVEPN
jgi:hypothetical protein